MIEIINQINNINFLNISVIIFIFSLILDLVYGEIPSKVHPVVIIGNIISFLTDHLINLKNRLSGLFLLLLTIIISLSFFIIILLIASKINYIFLLIVYIFILSSTFSFKLLINSAEDIRFNLIHDIDKARESVGFLVSRDTEKLDEKLIISATIETLSENIVDSYISPVFYFFLGIIIINFFDFNLTIKLLLLILFPLIYRIVNTLDAMVGYKNEKYTLIGFIPANFDDILNFIPARIGGIFVIITSFILDYNWKNSYNVLINDSQKCSSPNSGYTMAPTAGALGIQLVKQGVYIIGSKNKELGLNDIKKSIDLSKTTMFVFTITILILFMVFR